MQTNNSEIVNANGGSRSLHAVVRCPECGTDWKKDCEQAIRVELFGICIACACDKKEDMRTAEVIHERVRRLDAQNIHHDYDLRDYPLRTPNAELSDAGNQDARNANAGRSPHSLQ